jgi:hypothetical protein
MFRSRCRAGAVARLKILAATRLRLRFLDGWHGLVYAYIRANYVRQKTIMLWLLQNQQLIV